MLRVEWKMSLTSTPSAMSPLRAASRSETTRNMPCGAIDVGYRDGDDFELQIERAAHVTSVGSSSIMRR